MEVGKFCLQASKTADKCFHDQFAQVTLRGPRVSNILSSRH